MSFKILGTGSYAPEHVVTNDDLSALVDTNDEWITQRIGVRSRHISETETNVDMAVKAAERALENAGISADELDLIIATTITGDTLSPGTGCMVQYRIGAHCPAFDLAAACSGFLFALETAAGFLSRGAYNRVLVVSAERMSGIIDWTDRGTCCIFGDGAGAVLLEDSGEGECLSTVLRTEFNAEFLNVEMPANNNPFSERKGEGRWLQMNGQEVYRFAVSSCVSDLNEAAQKAGVALESVDWFLLHQANQRIIKTIARQTDIPEERFLMNIEQRGNTGSPSCAISLSENLHKVKPGDLVGLTVFGGGYSCGAMLLQF